MKKVIVVLSLFLLSLFFWGCTSSNQKDYKKKLSIALGPNPELVFHRYEEVFFDLDTADFQYGLMEIQKDFLPFLDGDLTNLEAINYLKSFACDTFARSLYQVTMEQYPNLASLEEIIVSVNRHFNYYYPQIRLPQQVYTCVSGVNPQDDPIMIIDGNLIVSLDWYLNGDEVYDWLGMPRYLSDRTITQAVAKDYGRLLYSTYIDNTHKQGNLLEEMVYYGKMDYFVEAMYTSISDEVLLGYPKEQLVWAEANEGEVWADLVGNQQLYSTDLRAYRMFFADGPFTNEYSHSAPPRLGEYLGLQIVRSYMGGHEVSLQDMLSDEDLQGLFLDSGYKPKK